MKSKSVFTLPLFTFLGLANHREESPLRNGHLNRAKLLRLLGMASHIRNKVNG